MPLNPSHVPRLVYDFLSQSGCQKAADQYADECPYLTGLKYFAETSGNQTLPRMHGPSLLDIVDKFYSTHNEDTTQPNSDQAYCKSHPATQESDGKNTTNSAVVISQQNTSSPTTGFHSLQNQPILIDYPLTTQPSTGMNTESESQQNNSGGAMRDSVSQCKLALQRLNPKGFQNQVDTTPATTNIFATTSKTNLTELTASSHLNPVPLMNGTTCSNLRSNTENVKLLQTPACVSNLEEKITQTQQEVNPHMIGFFAQPVPLIRIPDGASSPMEKTTRPVRLIAPKPSPLVVDSRLGETSPPAIVMDEFMKKLDTMFPLSATQLLTVAEALAQNPEISVRQLSSVAAKNQNSKSQFTNISTMSSVEASAKCFIFMSALLHMSKHPGCAAAAVRMLVESLINGIIDAKEFVKDLQRIWKPTRINSSLVPFLNVSIPHLRHFLSSNKTALDGIKISQTQETQAPKNCTSSPVPTLVSNASQHLVAATIVTTAVSSPSPVPKSAEPVPVASVQPELKSGCKKRIGPARFKHRTAAMDSTNRIELAPPTKPVKETAELVPAATVQPKSQFGNKKRIGPARFKNRTIDHSPVPKPKRSLPALIALPNAGNVNFSQSEEQIPVNEQPNPAIPEDDAQTSSKSEANAAFSDIQASLGPPSVSYVKMSSDEARTKCCQLLSFLIDPDRKLPENVCSVVRAQVQKLVNAEIEPESFVDSIVGSLKCPSFDPRVIPFLKVTLPPLRLALSSKELTINGINPPPKSVLSPNATAVSLSLKARPSGKTTPNKSRGTLHHEANATSNHSKDLVVTQTAQNITTPVVPFTPFTWVAVSSFSETPEASIRSPSPTVPISPCKSGKRIRDSLDPLKTNTSKAGSHSATEFPSALLALKRIATDTLNSNINLPCDGSPTPAKRKIPETRPCSVILRRTFDLHLREGKFSISM